MKEVKLEERKERKMELMDDFKDVSGDENYINPALYLNMVSLKWTGGTDAIHCDLKVSPKIEDVRRSYLPSGTKYVYSLILDRFTC